jgi:hypothetical protein
MVNVPVRWFAFVLVAIVKSVVPFPVPLAPPRMLIQETLLLALQLHPEDVVIAEEPEPPTEPTVWVSGVIAYVHAAAACVTV